MAAKRRRRYRFKKRFFVIVGVFALLVVLAAALLLRSCGKDEAEKPGGEAPKPAQTTLGESGDAGDGYLERILFVGDSRTLGLASYDFLPASQVLAEDGLNHKNARTKKFVELEEETLTIAQAAGKLRPAYVLVSFGINGMESFSEGEFMKEFEGLMEDIRAETPQSALIVQSIYPVEDWYAQEKPKLSNTVIDGYNQKLLDLCKENGYYYLDTAQALKDDAGALDPSYSAGDGLHINVDAYSRIIDYIKTHPVP